MTIFSAFNMPWYGLHCSIIIYYSTHAVIAYHLIQIGLSQKKGAKILMQEQEINHMREKTRFKAPKDHYR